MRAKVDIEQAIDRHGDDVWRACAVYFTERADAQDAFQETFLKYSLAELSFDDDEHRKAWLIRVAINTCKDMLKAAHRKNLVLDDDIAEGAIVAPSAEDDPSSDLRLALKAIRNLTDPPRTPVYLSLYEGYTAPEISEMLDAPVNTVYSWISRGREQLKEALR